MIKYCRLLSLAASLVMTVVATSLFVDYIASNGWTSLNFVRVSLLTITTFGLAWGATLSFGGLVWRKRSLPSSNLAPRRLTAIVIPICNEDPLATFSRVAAMHNSLKAIDGLVGFHFVILSDTRDPRIAALEEEWFLRLISECDAEGLMFYRRREANVGKKAGNIADFVRTSGGLYDFLLILDADSLLEGRTMVEMVRRLDAAPSVGLIQTLPKTIHARSWFGRAMQFSSWFFAPTFARGLSRVQGSEGVFWGHNAIIRTRAFASSCGMPELSGAPPFGGHILSHDYVEAALLARAGWRLRLDSDLEGSFEEAPESILDFAKRDRRWCQGNLQHARLLLAPRPEAVESLLPSPGHHGLCGVPALAGVPSGGRRRTSGDAGTQLFPRARTCCFRSFPMRIRPRPSLSWSRSSACWSRRNS